MGQARMRRGGVLAAVLWGVAVAAVAADAEPPAGRAREVGGMTLADLVAQLSREYQATITVDDILKDRTLDPTVVAGDLSVVLRMAADMVGGEVEQKGDRWFVIRPAPRITYSTGADGEDVKAVVQAIALSAGANVFVSPNVQGRVYMQATDIPWKQALRDAVRTAGDYAMVEEPSGVIRVVESSVLMGQVETEVFRLKYLRPPTDFRPTMDSNFAVKRDYKGKSNREFKEPPYAVADFQLIKVLEKALTPNIGSLDYDAGTNSLIVRDIRPRLDEIRRILSELDVQPLQVNVRVNFIKTTDTDFLDYGIDWGNAGPAPSFSGASTYTALPFNLGGAGLTGTLGILDNDETSGRGLTGGRQGQEVDNFLKDRVDSDNPHAFEFGVMDFRSVQAVLKFVKRDVKSKIVQAPQIATLDREKATIFVGETVRFAQTEAASTQSGTLSFVLREADSSPVQVGFQLLIIPYIIPEREQIRMTVIPLATSLSGTSTTQAGFDTFSNGTQTIDLPRVTSRTVITDVLLESRQAVVIGGLLDTNESEEVTKWPILGDIPVLEFLFKNRNRNLTVENLMIFVEPEIVRTFDDAAVHMNRVMRRGVWDLRDTEDLPPAVEKTAPEKGEEAPAPPAGDR